MRHLTLLALAMFMLLIQYGKVCHPEEIPKLATYKNRKFGFEVGYPEHWKADISESKKGITCRWSKNDRSVYVFTFPLKKPKESSLVKLLKEVDKVYLFLDRTEKFQVTGQIGRRDHPALIGYGHRKVEELVIMVTKHGNLAYTVIVSDPDERQEQLAIAIFKTFKITKAEEKS